MTTKEIGNLGENLAQKFLKDKGYKILDKNFSFRIPGAPQKGEIDIIAKKGDIISFVEVKTLRQSPAPSERGSPLERRQGNPFLPEDKVDFRKRKRIIKTAEYWLTKNKIPLDSKWQINIIAVTIDLSNKKAKIKYFKNITC